MRPSRRIRFNDTNASHHTNSRRKRSCIGGSGRISERGCYQCRRNSARVDEPDNAPIGEPDRAPIGKPHGDRGNSGSNGHHGGNGKSNSGSICNAAANVDADGNHDADVTADMASLGNAKANFCAQRSCVRDSDC